MHILIPILIALSVPALAQTVTITDTLRVAAGNQTFNGTVTITSPFLTYGGITYLPGSRTIAVSNGAFTVSLIPNVGATPTQTYYRVTYQPRNPAGEPIAPWTEMWEVGASGPYTVAQVRVPGQITNPSGSPLRDPTTTVGDMIVRTANGLARLPVGSAGQVLSVANGIPAWATGGGSGGGCWGCITGTLSAQTDLQNALNAKANLSHVHLIADVTGLQDAIDGKENTITTLPQSKGGTGTDLSASSGILKTTGGTMSVISGSNTQCVLGDGTLGDCGTGGGTTTSVAAYRQEFTSQTSVTLAHGFLSEKHIVDCYNGSGVRIGVGSITAGSASTTVTFATAQTGACVVLGGTGLYEATFTSQTTVNIVHNLNTTKVIAQCRNGSNAVIEGNASIVDANTVQVGFAQAQTGSCAVVAELALAGGGGGGGTTYTFQSPLSEFGGTVSLGTVPVDKGGTGQTTVTAARNALLPTKTGQAGKYLRVNAGETDYELATVAGGGGTVTTSTGLLGDGSAGDPVRVNPATVPTFLTGSATINGWGTIGAQTCAEQTFALAGAVSNDAVIPRWPAALPAGLSGLMRVSGLDTIAVRLCNPTASGVAVANGFQFGVTIVRSF